MAPGTTPRLNQMTTTFFVDTKEAVRSMVGVLSKLPTTTPDLYIDLEGTNLCREGTLSIVTIHVRSRQEIYIVDITTLRHVAFDTPASNTVENANTSIDTAIKSEDISGNSAFSELKKPTVDLVAALKVTLAASTLESTAKPVNDQSRIEDRSQQRPTLRTILESRNIPKVFFDVRNDSDALFTHYSISLNCVHDVQLMEVATRSYRRLLHGLARCISQDAGLSWRQSIAWQDVKDKGKLLFDQDDGNKLGVFDQRPMPEILQQYCVNDVVYLPRLREKYWGLLSEHWRKMILDESAARVRESQASNYRPQGRQKAEAPVAWNF